MLYTNNPSSQKLKIRYVLVPMILLCLAASSGCAVGPDFKPPEGQVPAAWAGPAPLPAITPAENDLTRWWTVFDDKMLASLVAQAVESNLDLKFAEARIRQARAARGIAQSFLGPTLDAAGSIQRSEASVSPTTGTGGINGSTVSVTANQYFAGFDAAWELDIFGGVRRGIEAADADLQASVEARRDVLVTLTAEVARNYIDLRAFQQRISIARQNLDAQKHSARLTRQRFEGGFASGLDVANAEAQVATTAAVIPLLEASARQTIYSLSVLLGRQPAALVQELAPALAIPTAPPAAPMGVPSDLLRRRPDIRQAEAGVHAATARIGVAEADLFPRFTITGSVGLRSSDLGSWLDWGSRLWSIGPSVTWRVFDTGRIRSGIAQQEALQEQSLITYEKTVLTALQEVEGAMISLSKEQEHRNALVDAVAYNEKAVDLSIQLYTEGQTDFLNVLQAQRALFLTQDALAQSTQTISTDLVALYKALGGGWNMRDAEQNNTIKE
jgi:NodT family efflux transporter outer membrane factor (OMF) lipoprotein